MCVVLHDDAYDTVPVKGPISDSYKESFDLTMRFSAQCAVPRVVIGFNPVFCADRSEEGGSHLHEPVTISPSEKRITAGSYKSGLTSSLEILLSSPRPQENKCDMQTLNIDSALNTRDRIPSHDSARSEQTQDEISCQFNTSNGQSELHHRSVNVLSELQGRQSSRKEQSWPAAIRSLQAPIRSSENLVQVNVIKADQRSRVFSFLPTDACPVAGIFEDPDITVSLSFPTMDFMEACFLCKRRLGEGVDIFMYRGNKAFCSEECRYNQILNDDLAERQEKRPFQSRPARRNYGINKLLSASSTAAAA